MADAVKQGGSNNREYVILEEFHDEGKPSYEELFKVEARNEEQALRRAGHRFPDSDSRMCKAVPLSHWRPAKPVTPSDRRTVAVG